MNDSDFKKIQAIVGSAFYLLLFLVFLTLKLTIVITWSWWWIAAPIWMPIAIGAILLTLGIKLIN